MKKKLGICDDLKHNTVTHGIISCLADELHEHVLDLGLDVDGLVANSDLCQAGQINQGNVQH